VLVGYGRVGRRIGEALTQHGVPFVVADQNRELVEQLRERGALGRIRKRIRSSRPYSGAYRASAHAGDRHTGHIRRTPDDRDRARLNPGIETVVRTHSDEEAALLRSENAGTVFMGEHELALGMTRHVLERIASPKVSSASH
jgi:CPA2 family monovalent cation:H+ antiporter-2